MSLSECILIGGAPLTGKSTLADKLAVERDAVQFSTDNVRDWMLRITNKNEFPDLFYSSNLNVEEFYAKYNTAQKVFDGEKNQSKVVEQGIVALLSCFLPWQRLIIEGIAITPDFVVKAKELFPNIKFEPIFLYESNNETMKKRINSRGLWDLADKYPHHIKEKELEWVILYNEFYKDQTKLFSFQLTNAL